MQSLGRPADQDRSARPATRTLRMGLSLKRYSRVTV